MAMTEKQIKRRMDEAWEAYYAEHDLEAEWYGIDDDHIWVCDIPSKQITVKMKLDEVAKRITITEAVLEKQNDYRRLRDTEWKVRNYYRW